MNLPRLLLELGQLVYVVTSTLIGNYVVSLIVSHCAICGFHIYV